MRYNQNLTTQTEDLQRSQSKVKVTDLLSRINEEKKIERKRNMAMHVHSQCTVKSNLHLKFFFNFF